MIRPSGAPEPARNESGYRTYTDTDVKRLAFILRAKPLDFSLDESRIRRFSLPSQPSSIPMQVMGHFVPAAEIVGEVRYGPPPPTPMPTSDKIATRLVQYVDRRWSNSH